MSKVGRPKADREHTLVKEELLKMNRPQLKGKGKTPVSMFSGAEAQLVEKMPKDATKRVVEWLKKITHDETYEPYPHKFKRVSELSIKEAEEMKPERELISKLNKKLRKYFGMKEQEHEEEAMFGTSEVEAQPVKKGKALRKKPKALEIELGENVNEPIEEKLKREIKTVINAPPVKPAELPKQFSYVQEPVGLQERPPQASPILSFSNKDFVAKPMKGDVSSLSEKDRLEPAPVKLEPEEKPTMHIPQFGEVSGYEFSQYLGYRPIVPTEKLEAKYNDEPQKGEAGAIQVDMVYNASGNNIPSKDQRFAAENEPIKEGGEIVQSLQDEIYTPEEIYRIRNMHPDEFTEFIQKKSSPKKALRFQKQVEPINRERMGESHAYTEDELKVMRAENANKVMTELTEARANREQDKTIGNRENTGLATRFSVPGKELITKPEEEIKKSISAFANMSWIEKGARADSKLGQYSSLQQMVDRFDEMRFTDVYTPISVQPKTREYLYQMYKRDIEGITNNRRIPEYDGEYTQERIPEHERDLRAYGARPVGSRYPTLHNIEDYTYDHGGVVGTQNLGMSNQYQDYTRPYFRDDHLQFPNTIFEHRSHRQRFI